MAEINRANSGKEDALGVEGTLPARRYSVRNQREAQDYLDSRGAKGHKDKLRLVVGFFKEGDRITVIEREGYARLSQSLYKGEVIGYTWGGGNNGFILLLQKEGEEAPSTVRINEAYYGTGAPRTGAPKTGSMWTRDLNRNAVCLELSYEAKVATPIGSDFKANRLVLIRDRPLGE